MIPIQVGRRSFVAYTAVFICTLLFLTVWLKLSKIIAGEFRRETESNQQFLRMKIQAPPPAKKKGTHVRSV